MTLNEAIYAVLVETNRPMTSRELADHINLRRLYLRKDRLPVTSSQIIARVNQYPNEFNFVQGEIFLTESQAWSEIVKCHAYILNLLRSQGRLSSFLFVAFLFFYKRISDISSVDYKLKDFPPTARIDYIRNTIAHQNVSNLKELIGGGIEFISRRLPTLTRFFEDQLKEFRRLEPSVQFEIFNILSQFDTTDLAIKKFGRIFEYLIHSSIDSVNREYFFTPQPIAELIGRLVNCFAPRLIYDPCVGLGGIFTEIEKSHFQSRTKYYGTDWNYTANSLGVMNLIANGIEEFDYRNENCLTDVFAAKFDFIVSNLPINVQFDDRIDLSFVRQFGLPVPSPKNGNAILLLHVLSKLVGHGRAFVTVPDGFLQRKGYDQFVRQFLIDHGLLEAVISLPASIFSTFSTLKISILCINNLGNSGNVKFINGGFRRTDNAGPAEIEFEEIVDSFKDLGTEDALSSIIPVNKIRKNDYILSVDQYNEVFKEAEQLLEQNNGQYLGVLVDVVAGISPRTFDDVNSQHELHSEGPILKIIKADNLKKDILELNILDEDVQSSFYKDKNYDRAIIRTRCLLIARIGENPKATIFEPANFPGQEVAIHRGVYALIPYSEDDVSIEYLYYQFYTPFVQKQLSNYRVGATIPYISKGNLNKIVIPLLEREQQNKIVVGQRANLIQLEREKIDKRLKMLGYEKEVAAKESDIVRILVHQLRPTFLSLNSQVQVIARIVDKHNIGNLKEFNVSDLEKPDVELATLGFSPNKPANYSLREICEKLSGDSRHLNDKLTYVNKVMAFKLEPRDFEKSLLKTFVQSHITSYGINNQLTFKIDVTGDDIEIEFNKQSMRELIEQLVNNAKAHAFGKKSANNLVKFNFRQNKNSPTIVLEYSNNGNDFKLSLSQYTSPFEKSQASTGSGIGGYYIKRIVEAHNGALSMNEKNKKGFSLFLEFPITQNSNSYE